MMRFRGTAVFLLLLAMALHFSAAPASAKKPSFKELLEARKAQLWVEGQRLGDMVLGARGQMEFCYVDKPLLDQARKEGWEGVPDWLRKEGQHFSAPELKGKLLFVIRYKALIPWTFSPEAIRVGAYPVRQKDVLTNRAFYPAGDLPSGTQGYFALGVPGKPGEKTSLCYGEYCVDFVIPGR